MNCIGKSERATEMEVKWATLEQRREKTRALKLTVMQEESTESTPLP